VKDKVVADANAAVIFKVFIVISSVSGLESKVDVFLKTDFLLATKARKSCERVTWLL